MLSVTGDDEGGWFFHINNEFGNCTCGPFLTKEAAVESLTDYWERIREYKDANPT